MAASFKDQLVAAGAVAAPAATDFKSQLAAAGATVKNPLDIFSDEALIADLSFSPKEEYIRAGGAAAFDAKQAARLGKIRKGQEAGRSTLGVVGEQLGNIIPAVPKVIAGVGKGIASGLNVFTAPAVSAIASSPIPTVASLTASAAQKIAGKLFGYAAPSPAAVEAQNESIAAEYAKLTEQRAAEDLHGAVAETAGLAKGVRSLGKSIARGTGISKSWSEMTDEEAFRAIIDEGESEREVRSMAQGDIPALAPTRERLAEEGTPVRPEKVQEATEHGTVGWLGFGAGLNIGGAAVKGALRGGVRAALPAIGAAERVAAADVALTAAKTAEGAAAKTLGEATTATTATGGAEALVQQAASARTLWESAQGAVKAAEENLAKLSEMAATERGSGILAAADKAAQLTSLRAAKDAALKAFQSGPKNAEREAALQSAQTSFKAAEEAIGESNLASAIEATTRVRNAVSTFGESAVQKILGRPIQAAGATVEGIAKATQRVPRGLSYLGAIGGLFVNPAAAIGGLLAREAAAPLIQRAGAAVKGYGKSVATGEARRTLDLLGAVKDTAAGGLKNYPMDYAFSVGLSDTEQEARAAAPIATALGVLPGAGRGIRRVVTGELVTPRAGGFKPNESRAYGENKVLDTAHATAMKTTDAKTTAQINWVRNLAKKMGGRVYLMPDATTFESTLTEVYKQQNPGAEITPAVAAQIKQMADQQGFAFGEFRAADGELQPTVFIKNPEAAVHEMGHILEKVVPAKVNERLDEQILARLSPENIEAAGTYYAKRLGRTEPWREVLEQLNPELTAEQYMARELRAENLGVALKNRGEAFATSPGMYRWLVQAIAKIGDAQGIPLAQSEALGFPIFGDVMAKGEKAARKVIGDEAGQALIEARDVRLKAASKPEVAKWAKATETPATGASEAAKVTEWLKTAEIPVASRAAAAQTLAEAIQNQQGVRLTYFGAKGEPGGDPTALRPERRAEIEAQRDAANTDRPLVTKDYFPYGAIITSKGPQFKGWSPNNFNANVTRFADWITKNSKELINIPMAHDLTTEAGKRGLQADLQTFVQNQQAGFTGSGRELVVPEGIGTTQPVKTGAKPIPLEQSRADAISYFFNLKLPETPRVTAGKLPLNIVGQRVSEATLPGRVVEPIRPRGEFTGPKAETLGIAGEAVREVNPFRQAVEQAAKDAGVKPPELIEAAQILALDRIADATIAPELPAFGGNVLTLTAGFLPAATTAREWKITGQKGGLKAETTITAASEIEARKLATTQGFRVEKASPVSSAGGALGQFLPGEMNTSIWRKPAKEIGDEVLAMTPEQFNEVTQNWRGGLTSEAQRVGLGLQAKEDVAALKEFEKQAREKATAAMKIRDFDVAMSLSSVSQFFREAWETATGTGSMGEKLSKNLGEAYVPPFPLDK